jgi:2,4-dienoyl-CoA reductase-like NADH-dependent reductase (Old Yellow Enzyme family)
MLSPPASPGLSMPDARGGRARFPNLFRPAAIGRMQLANRFVMAPMTTNYAAADGSVTPQLCEYLALRGRGGFGLIVSENIGVHPSGRVMPRMVMAHEQQFVAGLRQLAQAVHATGAKIQGQISHCGRQGRSKFTGLPLVAPSPIPCPLNREMPRELALDEIEELERAFVRAALRVQEAGFDAVEIHGAHGYLVSEFLSAYSNKRSDRYGGALENRMRFLLRVVDAIRREAGPHLPLTVRLSADEFVPGGITLAESTRIAKALEEHGVDAISVSVGVYETFNTQSMVTGEPEGRWLTLARDIKSALGIPVMGVGRIKRPQVAETAIAQGMVDFACFGRAAIADPEIPNKVARGEFHRIRWCLSCNVCLGRSARPETICPVNPAVGRDGEFARMLSRGGAQPRRIAILGSSMSCLTAAWVAAARGDRVVVYEPDGRIGGMQRWRADVPGQAEYAETIEALRQRAAEAGVEFVHELPADDAADVLWVLRRYQGGASGPNSSYAVLGGAFPSAAGTPLNVRGHDLASAEAALVLAERGATVSLRSPKADIALDAHPGYRALDARLLLARRVQIERRVPPAADTRDPAEIRGAIEGDAAAYGEEAGWDYPYGKRERAAAYISDAYEPGAMTRGIYEAVELAAA